MKWLVQVSGTVGNSRTQGYRPSDHGFLCCNRHLLLGMRCPEETLGLQKSTSSRVKKYFHSSPFSSSVALLSSLHFLLCSIFVFFFSLNQMLLLMVKASKVLLARPWRCKCRWNGLQWKMYVQKAVLLFSPTLLTLNLWYFIQSGIFSPS